MKAAIFIFVISLALPAFADDPAHDRIDIDVRHDWRPLDLTNSGIPTTRTIALDTSGAAPKFISRTPGTRATFMMPMRLPVDMEKFPTLILKYRGEHIATDNTLTCVWIGIGDNGESSAVFPLIDFNKLEFDGKPHEFRIDLPSAPANSKGDPLKDGKVCALWISVMNTADGDGKIQLDGMSFEAETPPAEAHEDQQVRVVVSDSDQKPIKNAKVIVDSERIAAAKSAQTDDDGLATITPLENETNQHMIRIEAEGMSSMIYLPSSLQSDPVRVEMKPAAKLSGIVRDKDAKPVKGATVEIVLPHPQNVVYRYDPYQVLAETDENGKWTAGPIADFEGSIQLTHPDFKESDAVQVKFEELKDGNYVTTLDNK